MSDTPTVNNDAKQSLASSGKETGSHQDVTNRQAADDARRPSRNEANEQQAASHGQGLPRAALSNIAEAKSQPFATLKSMPNGGIETNILDKIGTTSPNDDGYNRQYNFGNDTMTATRFKPDGDRVRTQSSGRSDVTAKSPTASDARRVSSQGAKGTSTEAGQLIDRKSEPAVRAPDVNSATDAGARAPSNPDRRAFQECVSMLCKHKTESPGRLMLNSLKAGIETSDPIALSTAKVIGERIYQKQGGPNGSYQYEGIPTKTAELGKQLGLTSQETNELEDLVSGLLAKNNPLGMDYAGRQGTRANLAEQEAIEKLSVVLSPGSGFGGIFAGFVGIMGGTAADMRAAAQIGGMMEGAVRFGGRGESASDAVIRGLTPRAGAAHGIPRTEPTSLNRGAIKGEDPGPRPDRVAFSKPTLTNPGNANQINPSDSKGYRSNENCMASTAAMLKNQFVKGAQATASDFSFTPTNIASRAASQIATAIGASATAQGDFKNTKVSFPAGDYAVFIKKPDGDGHVVYGKVLADGQRFIYDPQTADLSQLDQFLSSQPRAKDGMGAWLIQPK